MDHTKSLLNCSSVELLPNLSVRIPLVGEILENESAYYPIVSSLTATPFQYMVPLDDLGIDYTKITDYELFKLLFPVYARSDLSVLFGDLKTDDFDVYTNRQSGTQVLYSPQNNIVIDELLYNDLVSVLRKINFFQKNNQKPGNPSAQKYLLEKERKKQKRNSKKPYEPYLEKLVVALVNTCEFPYDYDSCMNLSIYRFNQSFRQIEHKINFDKTMIGVYSGTVDTSKLSNKDMLTWISNKGALAM